jgi:Short C-terminal domain
MPLMRRRPLLRAAMVGGGAYAAGKHVQRKQEHEYEQDAQLDEMQQAPPQQQYAPPPPAAAPAPAMSSGDMVKQLTDLKGLLDAGVLTQAEFDVQKTKILQGS